MHRLRKAIRLPVVILVVVTGLAQAEPLPDAERLRIDIYTIKAWPPRGVDEVLDRTPGLSLQVFLIDAIERFERELSSDLPADEEYAKRAAIQRLSRLAPGRSDDLQKSAQALAQAAELGIRRYPAIVFDHTYVIYGLRDLPTALGYFTRWQEEGVE